MTKFVSKYKHYRLVLRPTQTQLTQFGKKIIPGVTVEFRDGMYATDNDKIAEAMKASKFFGVDFHLVGGKTEKGEVQKQMEREEAKSKAKTTPAATDKKAKKK